MEKPKIIINGEEKEMAKPKVKIWREVIGLRDKLKEFTPVEFIDANCEVLAKAFNVSMEEIQNNIAVDEVIKKYLEVYEYCAMLIFSKAKGVFCAFFTIDK